MFDNNFHNRKHDLWKMSYNQNSFRSERGQG